MMSNHTLRAIALLALLLWPAAVSAQDAGRPVAASSVADDSTSAYTSAIDVGVAYPSADSFAFGKYTGLVDKTGIGVGNVVLRRRDGWDSGSTRYWEVLGTNLGLTSRAASVKVGNQGLWNAAFYYTQTPFYQYDTSVTIFGNAGSGTLSLPTGLPTNTNPVLGHQLLPFLRPQDLNLDRKTVGGSVSVQPGSGWQFTTNVSREHKEGLKEQSLSVNIRTDPAFFPESVNYDTSTVEATAAYVQKAVQLQLSYIFSSFTNTISAVVLPSPYLGAASQPVGTLSQFALPPSNTAHDINVATAYNITQTTRLNVNLEYGLQQQNEPLLAYTLNPRFAGEALPTASLNGKVRTTLAQFKLSARPTPKLDLSGGYTYDKRQNDTPQNAYTAMMEPEWIEELHYNIPYGFRDHNAKLDAAYRLAKRTKLSVGYAFQDRERTPSEVVKQTEHTLRAKLSQNFLDSGTSYVSYLYGARKAADYVPYAYDFALGNLPSTTPLLPYPNNREFSGYALEPNYYLFRRFWLADRTRNEVKAGANVDLMDGALSLDLSGRRTKDDYTNSTYGVTDGNSWAADADLAYRAGRVADVHVFYTFESILSNQTSLASTGIVQNLPTPQWTWTSSYEDRVHTVGTGAIIDVVKNKFRVGPSYELSLGNTDINVVSGPGAGTSAQYVSKPVPAITTSSYGAKLFGEYFFMPRASLRVVYDYEHMNTKDPALNTGPLPNTAATNLAGVTGAPTYGWLLAGNSSDGYTVQLVSASVILRF